MPWWSLALAYFAGLLSFPVVTFVGVRCVIDIEAHVRRWRGLSKHES